MVLCCICGVGIDSAVTTGARCVQCLRREVDVGAGVNRRAAVQRCGTCGRWLRPGGGWAVADMESRELLAICLKSIKGIGKHLQLVNASFIWTEPHSKELKVKLELQQEAMVGVVVRQAVIVELRVNNLQCTDCKKSYTKHTWDSSVQVRQRSEHRRTLMMLEQLILQHKAHKNLIQLNNTKDGLDFFFSRERDAQDFVAFLKSWAVVRHHESKHLVSHNAQNTTYRFKRTTCIEVCPVCRDDLVYLPRKVAQALGGLPPLMLCTKAASQLCLLDPVSMRSVEVAAEYWRKPFNSVGLPAHMTEFVVLDVEDGCAGRAGACEVEVARTSDFGKNDDRVLVRSHLGGVLQVGDVALGYDLRTMHLGIDEEEMESATSEVFLVKKKRPERTVRKKRPGKGSSVAASLAKRDRNQEAEAEKAEPEAEEEVEEEALAMHAAADAWFAQLDSQSTTSGTERDGESRP
ncbi:unnamed protein product, partial [Effrenium voratum]